MKTAIIEVAAVNLHCPICDVRLLQGDGQETWLRENFTEDQELIECLNCRELIFIPACEEVFKL